MRTWGNLKSAVHSRSKAYEHLRRSPSGSAFSPLVDAFHPSFPSSVGQYILERCELDRVDPPHRRPGDSNTCSDACPCHRDLFGHNAECQMNNASADRYFAEIDHTISVQRYHTDCHGESLLPNTSGTIFNLPREVSDLILSYLSPAALDAARYACKGWWAIILSNTWVLSSVLGVKEESLSGKLSHRDLLNKLDCDSDLFSTSQHPDVWRIRFRTRNLDFSVLAPTPIRKTATFVAAARAGTQNGWLAFQLQESIQHTKSQPQSTLIIYGFDLADFAWYAGAVHNVEGQGTLRIIGVEEIRRCREWMLRIDIGDTAGFYSLTAREAFSNSDSRFSFKRLESVEKVPGLSEGKPANRGCDKVPELLSIGDQFWNLLAPFLPNGDLHHACSSDGLRSHSEPCFLAAQTETGNIYVVMGVGAPKKPIQYASYMQTKPSSGNSESGIHYFTGIALLSCPRPNSVYRNATAAPAIIRDGGNRVAIVWQTTNLEKPISELYIYDIPEAVFHEPCEAYSQNTSDSVSTTVKGISKGGISQFCRLVQGKRVMSLDQHMGGVHTFSPLYHLACPQEVAMGGLQMIHTSENQEAYPRNVQYQKCFVWGPVFSGEGECSQISMKVFDFSFADPQRTQTVFRWRRERKYRNISLGSRHCACALHDDGYKIILPDMTTIEASEPTTDHKDASEIVRKSATEIFSSLNGSALSLWPWRTTSSAPDSVPNVGSISHNDSPARQAALERKQEWLRGRILGMKRAGLNDLTISELWNMSDWTQYGQIRKPEGWRDLGLDLGK